VWPILWSQVLFFKFSGRCQAALPPCTSFDRSVIPFHPTHSGSIWFTPDWTIATLCLPALQHILNCTHNWKETETKQFQNWFRTVFKLFCFSFVSVLFQLCGKFYARIAICCMYVIFQPLLLELKRVLNIYWSGWSMSPPLEFAVCTTQHPTATNPLNGQIFNSFRNPNPRNRFWENLSQFIMSTIRIYTNLLCRSVCTNMWNIRSNYIIFSCLPSPSLQNLPIMWPMNLT